MALTSLAAGGGVDLVESCRRRIAASAQPIYLSIVDTIAELAAAGELAGGGQLPPQRRLAEALGIDLTTVTRALNEARRRGLVEATVGRGSFIAADASRLARGETRALVDMTMNLPPAVGSPSLSRLLSDGVARLTRRPDIAILMSYRATAGSPEECAAGAAWLAPTLGRRDPKDLLVVAGAQAAMLAVLSTLLRQGEPIVAERFTYPGLRALAGQLDCPVLGVDMDQDGMRADDLDRVLTASAARLVYCSPNIQNPTTATMPLERRLEIVAVLRRHDVFLLEDDPYGLLLDEPLPALAALAPERVFHVATMAKVLSPGLRTAFLVVPDASFAERLTAAVRATSLMGSGLLTALTCQWIQNGQALEVLSAIRAELRERQGLARSLLGDAPCAHPAGPHVWLRLPVHWGSTEFVGYVRRQGLALVASEVFTTFGEPPPRVRIALGTASDLAALKVSLIAVAEALRFAALPRFQHIV